MSMSHTREYFPIDNSMYFSNTDSVATERTGLSRCGGSLLATVIMQPKLKQITWYWEDKTKIINDVDFDLDYQSLINEQKKSRNSTHWLVAHRSYNPPFTSGHTPENFYKTFYRTFHKSDWILDPNPLLGFVSPKLKLPDDIDNDNRQLKIDLDYSIKKLKERRNIIVYKEDIRHMATQWFNGGGRYKKKKSEHEFVMTTYDRINIARKYPNAMKNFLIRNDVPYEMFSLDTGDYRTIGFDKLFPRRCTDDIHTLIPMHVKKKVGKWVDDYMVLYP